MKIVFFGTSNVALPVLEELKKHHTIVGVVTKPDGINPKSKTPSLSPVAALAEELSLKTFKPQKVKDNAEFLEEIKKLEADIFIVVSYGKILPEELINLPKYKTLNVHFSLLPEYRGAAPIQYALLDGKTETGTSIFILDKDLDTGPILAQEKTYIDPTDTFFTLSDRLARISAKLLITTINGYIDGSIKPVEQDHTKATFTKIITREDGKIDWQKSASQIFNQFRAFYPWPGIWTTFNNQTLKVHDCMPIEEQSQENPGTVLAGGKVVCGNNTVLQLKFVQLEGKTQTDINSFLNGYPQFIGSGLK
jgi:methionyl-tRNA formyltransferase